MFLNMNKCANSNAKCKDTAADASQSEAALLLTPFACVLRLRPVADDLHAAIERKIGCTEQNVDGTNKLANKSFQNKTFLLAKLHSYINSSSTRNFLKDSHHISLKTCSVNYCD